MVRAASARMLLRGQEKGELPALTAEQMTAACKASLDRLRCDYIDLYQLLGPRRVPEAPSGRDRARVPHPPPPPGAHLALRPCTLPRARRAGAAALA